jgi:hypothetical protein
MVTRVLAPILPTYSSILTILQACDRCKKKKIRCDISRDSCSQCIKSNIPCTFTRIKAKGPRRPPGYARALNPQSREAARLSSDRYKHVEKLEERLKRMEAMLQSELRSRPAASDVEGEQSDADLPSDYIGTNPRRASPESQRMRKRKRRTSIGSLSGLASSAEQHISVSPHRRTASTPTTLFGTFKLTSSSTLTLGRRFTSQTFRLVTHRSLSSNPQPRKQVTPRTG